MTTIYGRCPTCGQAWSEPEVTEVMVNAALAARDRSEPGTYRRMHAVITAALKAREAAPALPGFEVTDAMVQAAFAALPGWCSAEIETQLVHAAILAALKAGCTHPRMGDWWLCNFGCDEVRTCPDCDRLEKRPAREATL